MKEQRVRTKLSRILNNNQHPESNHEEWLVDGHEVYNPLLELLMKTLTDGKDLERLLEEVRRGYNNLTEKEQEVFSNSTGVFFMNKHTLEATASRMSIPWGRMSRERVRQIKMKVLEKLYQSSSL